MWAIYDLATPGYLTDYHRWRLAARTASASGEPALANKTALEIEILSRDVSNASIGNQEPLR